MSGFFRNSPSKKPNVLAFPPPDLGMLRRSRRVLIFPKSRCIIYFGAHLPKQRPVYFFTIVPAMEYTVNII